MKSNKIIIYITLSDRRLKTLSDTDSIDSEVNKTAPTTLSYTSNVF